MDELFEVLRGIWMVVLLGGFMIIPMLHSLHMFQQNRYEVFRYQGWLKQQTSDLSVGVVWYLIKALPLIIIVFLPISNEYIVLVYGIVLIYIYLMFKKEKKKVYIKPLVYTSRVKRQIVVMAVLNILILTFIYYITDVYKWYSVYFIVGYFVNWFLVFIMAFITSPIESFVKEFYINKARKILAGMPFLIKVGITGSFGKTSSKNIMQEIMSEKFYSLMTPASYNTPMGITKTIRFELKSIHEVFLCEMGADKVGEIDYLTKFVKPKYGVVTSIGPQHLNTFKTLDNIINEKMKMIENLPADGVGILNKDNEYIREYEVKNTCKIVWYAIDRKDVDYYADNITYTPQGSVFDVVAENTTHQFTTKLLGKHNIANILASIALGRELNVSWEELIAAVKRVNYVEHRLEVKKINGYTFIDNAFNSNPVGSAMSLEVLNMMPNKRFIVTPGMIDLAERQYSDNFDFGANMKHKTDYVVLVGEKQTKPIYEGLLSTGFNMDNVRVVKTVKDAFDFVYQTATLEDTILLENDLPDAFNK